MYLLLAVMMRSEYGWVMMVVMILECVCMALSNPCSLGDVHNAGRVLPAPVLPVTLDFSVCSLDPPSQCLLGKCIINECWKPLERGLYDWRTDEILDLFVPVENGALCLNGSGGCLSGTCFELSKAVRLLDNGVVPTGNYYFFDHGVRDYGFMNTVQDMSPPSLKMGKVVDEGRMWTSGFRPTIFGRALCMDVPECVDYRDTISQPKAPKPTYLGDEIGDNACIVIFDNVYVQQFTYFELTPDGMPCGGGGVGGECYSGKCFKTEGLPYCMPGASADNEKCHGTVPDCAYQFSM